MMIGELVLQTPDGGVSTSSPGTSSGVQPLMQGLKRKHEDDDEDSEPEPEDDVK